MTPALALPQPPHIGLPHGPGGSLAGSVKPIKLPLHPPAPHRPGVDKPTLARSPSLLPAGVDQPRITAPFEGPVYNPAYQIHRDHLGGSNIYQAPLPGLGGAVQSSPPRYHNFNTPSSPSSVPSSSSSAVSPPLNTGLFVDPIPLYTSGSGSAGGHIPPSAQPPQSDRDDPFLKAGSVHRTRHHHGGTGGSGWWRGNSQQHLLKAEDAGSNSTVS